ncbi:uncharacterized protein (DUF1778 family) [Sediminihabitans luteus]|uniref:Uncharacterized protein (DUF1778 family) n=1 Tax=Sediminihabitans luteus TaxID=1138585 RepID=A0A2M9D0H0_9CELL|nr:DUF1778 domain-containing protein [Sediminihabitans luteus]PJJ77691.1 uncharacterized protein (DUF1778 family) [Sediminihabitans luteus]GIJ00082.1 hypothetical protein Slu03_24590 [Sediminihabitans luteus]
MSAATKDERLQVRVSPDEKHRAEEAARIEGTSLSSFVTAAVRQRVDLVLADRHTIVLGPAAAAELSDALARPAEVSPRMLAALSRPTAFTWAD